MQEHHKTLQCLTVSLNDLFNNTHTAGGTRSIHRKAENQKKLIMNDVEMNEMKYVIIEYEIKKCT
jgi:hypothetical protein